MTTPTPRKSRSALDARHPGNWVAFAFTVPWAAISWVLGGLSMATLLAHRPRFEGTAILTLEWREWFARGRDGKGPWRYSTTIGRTIWWQPGHRSRGVTPANELDERLERHEREHVWQIEDLMLLAFAVGMVVAAGHWAKGDVAGGFAWWLGVWTSGGLWQLPNFLTAAMRFGWRGVYRDASHERHAYAATARWPNGESWWARREAARETQEGIG